MTGYAVVGLLVMIVSETATIARIEPFWSWNTPIAWTGFILFADGIVFRRRGSSWITSAPGEFGFLAIASIPLWLVFEFFNRFIDNWYYVNLPENTLLRYFGYAWSFATIWPAMFEGAELIAVWRGALAAVRAKAGLKTRATTATPITRATTADSNTGAAPAVSNTGATTADRNTRATTVVAQDFSPAHLTRGQWMSIAVGAAMLVWPLIWPSRYLAAPVWLGFIFLLDPINERLGGDSLSADLRRREYDRLANLALSGLLCGVLWEFWNYWSHAKWHYTVPIMENLKIFEMPFPGYFGFPAFAFECFTMYVFVRIMWVRLGGTTPQQLGRTIAL